MMEKHVVEAIYVARNQIAYIHALTKAPPPHSLLTSFFVTEKWLSAWLRLIRCAGNNISMERVVISGIKGTHDRNQLSEGHFPCLGQELLISWSHNLDTRHPYLRKLSHRNKNEKTFISFRY
jgi:hypothetical protein